MTLTKTRGHAKDTMTHTRDRMTHTGARDRRWESPQGSCKGHTHTQGTGSGNTGARDRRRRGNPHRCKGHDEVEGMTHRCSAPMTQEVMHRS